MGVSLLFAPNGEVGLPCFLDLVSKFVLLFEVCHYELDKCMPIYIAVCYGRVIKFRQVLLELFLADLHSWTVQSSE